jgi:hypothetical protein
LPSDSHRGIVNSSDIDRCRNTLGSASNFRGLRLTQRRQTRTADRRRLRNARDCTGAAGVDRRRLRLGIEPSTINPLAFRLEGRRPAKSRHIRLRSNAAIDWCLSDDRYRKVRGSTGKLVRSVYPCVRWWLLFPTPSPSAHSHHDRKALGALRDQCQTRVGVRSLQIPRANVWIRRVRAPPGSTPVDCTGASLDVAQDIDWRMR